MKDYIAVAILNLVEQSDYESEICLACEQFVPSDSPHVIVLDADPSLDRDDAFAGLVHTECELRFVQMPSAVRFGAAMLGGAPEEGTNRFDPSDPVRTVGGFEWDAWKQEAQRRGVATDIAALGRSLMREAYQHSWSMDLQEECGWKDRGAAMMELALNDPPQARSRWNQLLGCDGDTRSMPAEF